MTLRKKTDGQDRYFVCTLLHCFGGLVSVTPCLCHCIPVLSCLQSVAEGVEPGNALGFRVEFSPSSAVCQASYLQRLP